MTSLRCKGHENLLGTHRTTIEFTKENRLTKRGDCIIGVAATDIPKALNGRIRITLDVDGLKDSLEAEANPDFCSKEEMVIRKSEFVDRRTFATRATKAACDIDRAIIEILKDPEKTLNIHISTSSV